MPIARLQVIIMPKCTGSTPTAVAMGTMMGVRIMMLGILSIIMPHTSIMAFIISRITTLLLETASTDSLMVCGYRSIVRQRANAVAAAITKRIFTYVFAPSINTWPKSWIFMVL